MPERHRPRVLICDPDPAIRRALRTAFARRAGPGETVPTLLEAEHLDAAAALAGRCGAVFLALPSGGEAAVARLRAGGFDGGLLAALDQGSFAAAVSAMRAGADDVMVKPLRAEEAARRLVEMAAGPARALSARSASPQAGAPRSAATGPDAPPPPAADKAAPDYCGFIGRSDPMRALYGRIERAAASRAPVFITGESGTGKEVCAAALHARSPRRDGPFHALNCAAIPRDLLEAEMFGHARGAFTGAHRDRAGAAELAHGGTLFLDEIGELDPALQAKLLRMLEEGRVRRIGEGEERAVDVRIVCATNRDPEAEVRAGRLRADLFYRLHVLNLHLPPLRERGEDVMLLASAFLQRFAQEEGRPVPALPPDAAARLLARDWPGNVRELQNLMRRHVVLGEAPERDRPASSAAGGVPPGRQEIEPFAVRERRIIEEAIAAFGGNVAEAAQALGLAASTLYRKKLSWQNSRRAG